MKSKASSRRRSRLATEHKFELEFGPKAEVMVSPQLTNGLILVGAPNSGFTRRISDVTPFDTVGRISIHGSACL